MFVIKSYASGGSGSRAASNVSANTQNQTRGRVGGVTQVTRGRGVSSRVLNEYKRVWKNNGIGIRTLTWDMRADGATESQINEVLRMT